MAASRAVQRAGTWVFSWVVPLVAVSAVVWAGLRAELSVGSSAALRADQWAWTKADVTAARWVVSWVFVWAVHWVVSWAVELVDSRASSWAGSSAAWKGDQ